MPLASKGIAAWSAIVGSSLICEARPRVPPIGLSIEAQREAILRFADAEGLALVAEHVETETGKGADALDRRRVLRGALAEAKRQQAAIIATKLDRLSRDVAFIAGLMA